MTIYDNDCCISYAVGYGDFVPDCGKTAINEFTRDSRRRLAFVASNTGVAFVVMVTLTYPADFPADGLIVKQHFKRFKDSLLRRYSADYLWCLEFQKRGAPHYHILIDNPGPLDDRLWVSRRWFDVVGSGDHKHLLAGTRVERLRSKEGGKRYVVKYASKMRQKKVPDGYANVGRFWGHSRNVKPIPIGEIELGGYAAVRKLIVKWDRAKKIKLPLTTLYNASRSVLDVIVES
jgi:hypothetical protein